jgi:hypothetical protein
MERAPLQAVDDEEPHGHRHGGQHAGDDSFLVDDRLVGGGHRHGGRGGRDVRCEVHRRTPFRVHERPHDRDEGV